MNLMSTEDIRELTRYDILTKYLIRLIEEEKYIDREELKALLIMLGKIEGSNNNE